MELSLAVAARVSTTTAEGPGDRYALWTQGCTLGCPGCCNPEFQTPTARAKTSVTSLLSDLEDCCTQHGISGLTVLGGEPLQQLGAITAYCWGARALGLGIIVFTGYTLAEAQDLPGFTELWASIDTLVAGPYRADQIEPSWREGGRSQVGSSNQRLHHRTERYRAPELWQQPARVELSYDADGRVHLHGAPRLASRVRRSLRAPNFPANWTQKTNDNQC